MSAHKKLKVMTIVGTRPEVIKLSRVLCELDEHFDHVLVHTGQNYDRQLNQVFFDELKLKMPKHVLNVAGTTAAQTIANVIAKSDEVMEQEAPDAVLIYGDTNSCLSVISAKRRKIPVFHMEAGNRSFDERVPEEINRRLVDHLSDINMTLCEHARGYLLREGIRAETIIKTGSSMPEVLDHYRSSIDKSDAVARLGLKPREYFVVSTHREENVDAPEPFKRLLDSLNALHETWGYPVIVSTHPRTRKRLESLGTSGLNPGVRFMDAMGFFDYVKLQQQAFCVVSDSGTITEESTILGFPAVTIREAHERPEGMDVGTLVMTGLDRGRVIEAVRTVTAQQSKSKERVVAVVPDYESAGKVSVKVARILLSYTDYVNRTVWRKY